MAAAMLFPVLLAVVAVYTAGVPARRSASSYRHRWYGCTTTVLAGVVTMNCQHSNLTSPPFPPQHCGTSLHVDLSHNRISHLYNMSFMSYSRCNVVSLLIGNNNMTSITAGAFEPLKNLSVLSLSGNIIQEAVLQDAFTALSQSPLSGLNLSFMSLQSLSPDFLKGLSNLKKISNLILEANNLQDINFTHAYFPKLRRLVLDNNKFDHFPNFCIGDNTSSSRFPNLKILKVQWNFMRYLDVDNYKCLRTLTRLYLNGNVFLSLETNQFAMLQNIYKITLSYSCCFMRGSLPILNRAVFNNTSLKQIYFRVNHVWFHEKEVDLRVFEGCTSLQLLNLNDNIFQVTKDYEYDILLGNLTALQVLVIGRSGMNRIPPVISRLTQLRSLALYGNSINNWDAHTFDKLTNLIKLFMSSNQISMITDTVLPEAFVKRAQEIDFNENPFSCTCDLMWFVDWLKQSPNQFKTNRDRYVCSTPERYNRVKLINVPLTEKTCLMNMEEKITTLTCSILMIVFLVVGAVLHRHRWDILYVIYLIRYRQRPEVDSRTYEYDAFVVYSADDVNWVENTLLPVLEEKEDFKICIHDRDFAVGKLILDNIVDSINSSRKMIIVLSNSFAQSCWCQFELNLIQKHVLETGQRLLVVVMLETIDTRHLTNALRIMLKTTTYLTWGEEGYTRTAFFNRLRLLLQRPRMRKRRLSV